VSGGIAVFATSSLAAGMHSLTAVYSGNANFRGSSSAALSIAETAPDFTMTASPSTQTLLPSRSVSYTLTLTPVSSTFASPVRLTASGLPAGVMAAFTPASLAAGSGASTVQLALSASWTAQQVAPLPSPIRWNPTGAVALLLPLLIWRRSRRGISRPPHAGRKLLALLALLVGSTIGCGGGYFLHPVKSYPVTITAVSGPISHTTSVNVVLE
jgi:hypothetical protein